MKKPAKFASCTYRAFLSACKGVEQKNNQNRHHKNKTTVISIHYSSGDDE
ncbi:hypothetical protein P4G36_20315 [Escherichia coli]|nr:hypothetical protein [Escherichia coli]